MQLQQKVRNLVQFLNKPWIWIAMSVAILVFNYYTGPAIHFPVAYIVIVALAAWNRGEKWAIPFAVILPLLRFALMLMLDVPKPGEQLMNAIIMMIVLVVFSVLVATTARQTQALEREVKLLEGILPICCHCKKIRSDRGDWVQMETYISSRTDAQFSHGFCEECAQKHYGQYRRSA